MSEEKKPTFEEQNERLLKAFESLALTERHKLQTLRAGVKALEACEVALGNIATALNVLLPPMKIVDPQKAREQADKIRSGWSGY